MSTGGKSSQPRVLIVGAGPSGLAAAIELGSRDVPCLVIERTLRGGHAPRAKTTHTRTCEHLRRWGIAGKLAEASPFGIGYPSNVLFVTRLAGKEITRFENAMFCAPAKDERYSEHAQWIPQYKLERVLLEHAQSLPAVEIVFGREFVALTQDESQVRVRIRDAADGAEEVIAVDYVIGSDGARSAVRDAIGAKLEGTYGLSRNYNTIFRAPRLAEAHSHAPAIMYWQINADAPSLIGPMDQDDIWFFMPTGIPEGVTYSDEEIRDLIRRSTGIDLPYEILSSDEWVASRLLADRYAEGRVFLSGDACHLHPPFGGYGMNMGVADSVDLGWKIAAVLQGWGGSGLLDSYARERRPAHEWVLEEAQANHALVPNQMLRPHLEENDERGAAERAELAKLINHHKAAEFHSLGVVLGYCYQDSPVLVRGADDPAPPMTRNYQPSAAPGCLAPHRWLADGSSLYDAFGAGFTLLALDGALEADIEAARAEAHRTATPLKIMRRAEPELAELYGARLTLIRPDQHVAWRGDRWDTGDLLSMVTGRRPAQN